MASKEKGSNNRRKAVLRLAAFKARQARIRRDAIEKVTTDIAKSHGAVALENLNMRAMTASASGTAQAPGTNVAAKAGLNRSLLDVAPGLIRLRLGHKLAAAGGVLLAVPPAHTSQRCRRCGDTRCGNRASRDDFVCLACGHAEDADVNAAHNIRDRALGLWGDASKVQVAASLEMLLAQQARPKRSFRKKTAKPTGGLPAQACQGRGLRHGTGRKRVAVTRPSVPASGGARSSVL